MITYAQNLETKYPKTIIYNNDTIVGITKKQELYMYKMLEKYEVISNDLNLCNKSVELQNNKIDNINRQYRELERSNEITKLELSVLRKEQQRNIKIFEDLTKDLNKEKEYKSKYKKQRNKWIVGGITSTVILTSLLILTN